MFRCRFVKRMICFAAGSALANFSFVWGCVFHDFRSHNSVNGPEKAGTTAAPTAGSNIEISMHQIQLTMGYTYKFAPPAPVQPMIHK